MALQALAAAEEVVAEVVGSYQLVVQEEGQ
jgi:hypothetical protein